MARARLSKVFRYGAGPLFPVKFPKGFYQIELDRIRGQHETVFEAGLGRAAEELIAAGHDQQAIAVFQLHHIQRKGSLDIRLFLVEGTEEILQMQSTVIVFTEHRT